MNPTLYMFVIAVTVLMVMKMTIHIGTKYQKDNKLCINCNGVMQQDLLSVGIVVLYIVMSRMNVKGVSKTIVMYAALVATFLMATNLMMALSSKLAGQTPVSIGAEAAAKPGAEAAETSTNMEEAKMKGSAAGANAASKAAESAGLSDDEIIEATIAGSVTGAAVAESMVQMN